MIKPPSCDQHPAWPKADCKACESMVADALHRRVLSLADLDKSAMVQALEKAVGAALALVLSDPGNSITPYFSVHVTHITRRYVVTAVISATPDEISDVGYHNIHTAIAEVLETQRVEASLVVVIR